MKRRRSVVITVIIALVLSANAVYASTELNAKEFNSGEKVFAAMKAANVDGKVTPSEVQGIKNKATNQAMREYHKLSMNAAAEAINESNPTLDDGQVYRRISYVFEDGATAELILYDLAEEETLDDIDFSESEDNSISPMAMDVICTDHIIYRTKDKGYGSRYFTSTYRFSNLTATCTVELTAKNYYKISSTGLEATDCDLTPYYFGAVTNVSWYHEITDKYAKTPGSSDINILSTLRYDRVAAGLTRGPYYLQLDSRVGFVAIDKTNKTATVTEHVYIYRTNEP